MSKNILGSLRTSTRRLDTASRIWEGQQFVCGRKYSTHSKLPSTERISWRSTSGGGVDIEEFRRRYFEPEVPVHITREEGTGCGFLDGANGLRAGGKWFEDLGNGEGDGGEGMGLKLGYLETFGDVILPYELVLPAHSGTESGGGEWGKEKEEENIQHLLSLFTKSPIEQHTFDKAFSNLLVQSSPSQTFHRFPAPLSLFLHAARSRNPKVRNLYIAQAQLLDLPHELRMDLPTPELVLKTGKGDVYDANLWLGIPPTYTPLHRDPNPNLFVQLRGCKCVRMFPGRVGGEMFRVARERVRGGEGNLRGSEMMEGREREVMDGLVWGADGSGLGREVVVREGEGLFVPRGWWHCVVSEGQGVNGSVNWWFR